MENMEHILKLSGVTAQVCEALKSKGIKKNSFLQILQCKDGNAQKLRSELCQSTGLQAHQVMQICELLSQEIQKSQMNSSMQFKGNNLSSVPKIVGKVSSGMTGSQKRLSALLQQPQPKPATYSNPLSKLQNSSFVVKKEIIPVSKPNPLKKDQSVKVEEVDQQKIEPMKSPTEVKPFAIDNTVADSGDSGNPPSESEVLLAPAQFVAASGQAIEQQELIIIDLQKSIVRQSVDQIFDEKGSQTESEGKEEDEAPAETIVQEQQNMPPEEDNNNFSLSSSEDEDLMNYKNRQLQLQTLNQQLDIEQEDDYSSSSSGTLSPIHSNLEPTFSKELVIASPNITQEVLQQDKILVEDGPLIEAQHQQQLELQEVEQNNKSNSLEDHSQDGFIIQGLRQEQQREEDQAQVQDQMMQEENEQNEVQMIKQDNVLEVIQDAHHEKLEDYQQNDNLMAQSNFPKINYQHTKEKVQTVDTGMQCDPWEPQVIHVEPERKVMKNKKLQVTPERIEKSTKSPGSQQEEQKASPIQQDTIQDQESSSDFKALPRQVVPGRTQVIPISQQFYQSSACDSSIQTSKYEDKDEDLTLSQLLENTNNSNHNLNHSLSYSQKPPEIKSILKRYHHERLDYNLQTQPENKRVKWDPQVVEKSLGPGEDSYMKRELNKKKQVRRNAQQQIIYRRNQLSRSALDSSSSEEDYENQFYEDEDGEEELEDEEVEDEDLEVHQPHLKRRRLSASRDDSEIHQDDSQEDEEENGICNKIRSKWSSGIKNWLSDINSSKKSGRRPY